MSSPTDLARWEANARQHPAWIDRNRVLASWIRPGSSVLDVGAGSRSLEPLLPAGCTYVGIDVTPTAGAGFVDFNAFATPRFDHVFDYAIVSGVLEYVVDPGDVLRAVRSWARHTILSYAPATPSSSQDARRRSGWINDLTAADLATLFAAHGFTVLRETAWESQRVYHLEVSVAAPASSPQRRPWPVSLFRADATNVGDWWSAPRRYITAFEGADVDIFRIDRPTAIDAPVIIGGGGLFHPVFEERFARVSFSPAHPVIGWGVGENSRLDLASGWVDDSPSAIPAWAGRCDVLGVRDYGSEAPWVPCASCLHPLLLAPRTAKHEVVVYAHKRLPIDPAGLPYLTNDGADINAALDFLGSGHVVVTNSYHGAYWATLLGRAVVALPFSSKFWGLRHRPVMAKPDAWSRAVEFARPYPHALTECRQATSAFMSLVAGTLGRPLAESTREPQTSAPTLVVDGHDPGWQTTAEVEQGLAELGVGPIQRTTITAELSTRLPVWCMRTDLDLPARYEPWRAVVIAPDVRPTADIIRSRTSPAAEVVIVGSEAPTLDALKSAFDELWHLGVETPSRHEVWCGVRDAGRLSARPGRLPRIVSFFTAGTAYEGEAQGLAASCRALGVRADILAVEPRGTWEANCATKASFLRERWREGAPLLWVDADARLHRVPDRLRGVDADFGVHKVNGWQFASGTLFFNFTPLAGVLLDTWVRLCRECPHVFDQVLLDAAWEEVMRQYPLQTIWLPAAYTLIQDHHEAVTSREAPVIVHHQASRRLKGTVSNGTPARPHPAIAPDWRRARKASRGWIDTAGQPKAACVVMEPDYVRLPGTPELIPPAFSAFEAQVVRWIGRHSSRAGRVGIFGASWFGGRLAARFRLAGIEPAVFMDSDAARHTDDHLGIPVVPAIPVILEQLDTVVVASVTHAREIVAMLAHGLGASSATILAPDSAA